MTDSYSKESNVLSESFKHSYSSVRDEDKRLSRVQTELAGLRRPLTTKFKTGFFDMKLKEFEEEEEKEKNKEEDDGNQLIAHSKKSSYPSLTNRLIEGGGPNSVPELSEENQEKTPSSTSKISVSN